MKKTFNYALSLVFLFSCGKPAQVPTPINPGPFNEGSEKQLIASIETTSSDNGKLIVTFKYNDKNQLIEMHEKTINGFPAEDADHYYTYNSNGDLIRSKVYDRGGESYYTYEYDDSKPVKVNFKRGNTDIFDQYIDIKVTDGRVINKTIRFPLKQYTTVDYLYENDNKVNEFEQQFISSNELYLSNNYVDEYGNHKSPFLYSGYKWLLPDIPFANKNDGVKQTITRASSVTPQIFTNILEYKNTYDKHDYPIKVETIFTNTGQAVYRYNTTYRYINAK